MLPVKNFISFATIRRGSTCKSLVFEVARVTAFETMLPATCTAAPQAEDRCGVLWYAALWFRILTSKEAALKQSEHGEIIEGVPAARARRSSEAPGRSCIATQSRCSRVQLISRQSALFSASHRHHRSKKRHNIEQIRGRVANNGADFHVSKKFRTGLMIRS